VRIKFGVLHRDQPGVDVGVAGFERSEKHYRWMLGPLKTDRIIQFDLDR
jgi:hypothetical protein